MLIIAVKDRFTIFYILMFVFGVGTLSFSYIRICTEQSEPIGHVLVLFKLYVKINILDGISREHKWLWIH